MLSGEDNLSPLGEQCCALRGGWEVVIKNSDNVDQQQKVKSGPKRSKNVKKDVKRSSGPMLSFWVRAKRRSGST